MISTNPELLPPYPSIMKTFYILLISLLVLGQSNAQIRVNQTLQISIQGVPQSEQTRINSTYQVSSSGTISMWEIGKIRASGSTADQLATQIAAAYKAKQIYTNPSFSVITPNEAGLVQMSYTVGGAVRGSGQKPFTDGLTLFGAIQAAGGETEFGALTRIKLFRNGKVKTFNLKQDSDKAFLIRPDDMIEVPQKNWAGR